MSDVCNVMDVVMSYIHTVVLGRTSESFDTLVFCDKDVCSKWLHVNAAS